MTRASLLWCLLGASAALTACDIPSATFDGSAGGSTTTGSGGAGAGASTSSAGGSGTTTPMHTTSSTGGGGSGGSVTTSSAGGTGGSTTTTTTTTSSGGPTVPCGYPQPVMECDPGEVCCFEKKDPDGDGPLKPTDFCSGPGTCDPPNIYAELKCNVNADCSGNNVCCGYYALDPDGEYRVQKTYCKASCDAGNQEIKTCESDADCEFLIEECNNFFGSAYPTYNFCLPPI